MKKLIITLATIGVAVVLAATPALATSGHFLTGGANAPVCTDIGTQVHCVGKVAGLGGTTFRVEVHATGVASVECINPGGNRAPGQDTVFPGAGGTDDMNTPRNGRASFSVTTAAPGPLPSTPTCPNSQWTATVVDVVFTTATLSLYEDNILSDRVVVPVS
jgi:hypothetical protein